MEPCHPHQAQLREMACGKAQVGQMLYLDQLARAASEHSLTDEPDLGLGMGGLWRDRR